MSGQRILILDDERAFVFLATRMLEALGHQVKGFTRATVATDAFRDDPAGFDLVLIDLNMPGASGLEIAADFLSVRPDLTVALCSGDVTPELMARAHDVGIVEVLYKPNTVMEFRDVVDRLAARTLPS